MRRYRSGPSIGAVVVMSALVSCASDTSRSPSSAATTDSGVFIGIGGGPSGPVGADPFVHGELVSLSQAEAAAGSALPRPNDPLGSDASVSKVWLEVHGTHAQVEVVYESELRVELWDAPVQLQGRGEQLKTFAEEAAQDSAQTNGASAVVSVNGVPALLTPKNSAVFANGQSQGAGGSIEFVVNGYVVDMFGQFTDDELMRAASSVSTAPQTA